MKKKNRIIKVTALLLSAALLLLPETAFSFRPLVPGASACSTLSAANSLEPPISNNGDLQAKN